MKPAWVSKDSSLSLFKGDCRLILPEMEAGTFTACITDPPYHLTANKKGGSGPASVNLNTPQGRSRITTGGFMGKDWDGGDVAFRPETWAEVLRVLRPGAHLLAFGGTRTFHRMACAIEDAGFELRDCIMYLYGSGFPKSLNVSKAIDKAAGAKREVVGKSGRHIAKGEAAGSNLYAQDEWTQQNSRMGEFVTAPATDAAKLWQGMGTALKPAYEPIILARKPLSGTVAANCQEHGCGALNIDACRVPTEEEMRAGTGNIPCRHDEAMPRGRNGQASAETRYTENGGTNFAALPGPRGGSPAGRFPANVIHDGSPEVLAGFPEQSGGGTPVRRFADKTRNTFGGFTGNDCPPGIGASSGNASRFFYCAKASKSDRGEGNTHPTVKPLSLMEYLVKLLKMPGENHILDPFSGSGTTLLACYNNFCRAVGIDLEADHSEIAETRAKKEAGKTPLFL